uniref:hypothetical protein n=1 Tax=Ningiella ruwaisensis TaxID=2364274 RepID=UPI001445D1C6|nr:hypothetical protein [Ningiella ruwaisensis]
MQTFKENAALKSISKKQTALLQAMGIDVYRAYESEQEQAVISLKPWFNDVLALLNIQQEDCEFSDAQTISFDPISRRLTLPFTLTVADSDLKRSIWQAIQEHVDLLKHA